MTGARSTIVLLLLLASASGACAQPVGSVPVRAPAPAAPATTRASSDELARAIVQESNRARADHGLRPLTVDTLLARVAVSYAQELALRRLLDHRSPTAGGETMTLRVKAAGVRWQQLGENLASVQGLDTNIAREMVSMWLKSPGHRDNLLKSTYTHTGTGAAADAYGQWYVVQLYMVPAR